MVNSKSSKATPKPGVRWNLGGLVRQLPQLSFCFSSKFWGIFPNSPLCGHKQSSKIHFIARKAGLTVFCVLRLLPFQRSSMYNTYHHSCCAASDSITMRSQVIQKPENELCPGNFVKNLGLHLRNLYHYKDYLPKCLSVLIILICLFIPKVEKQNWEVHFHLDFTHSAYNCMWILPFPRYPILLKFLGYQEVILLTACKARPL